MVAYVIKAEGDYTCGRFIVPKQHLKVALAYLNGAGFPVGENMGAFNFDVKYLDKCVPKRAPAGLDFYYYDDSHAE